MNSDYMAVADVAKLLGVSETTVEKLANEGWLPAYKLQGQWRFRRTDVERWISERDKRAS